MAKNSLKWLALLGGLAVGSASVALAQDSGPLIDTLVKKGILNDQEAEDLRVELLKDFGNSSAGKLNLSSALTELKISGDVRARYEYRSGENGYANNQMELNRYRYRLRLALTGKLQDGWFFGTRIEPGSNRSTNVTSGKATNPFSKADGALYIGQAYLGRKVDDFTFTAGRLPGTPLVTTSMLWDDDLNPEGLSEQWSHEVGKYTLIANLGQFVYEGTGTTNAISGSATNRSNTYLWAFQAGAKAKVTDTVTAQVLPAYYYYSGNDVGNGAVALSANTNSNALRTDGLNIIDVPFEVGFKVGSLPAKVFGDFAYNVDADDRAKAANKTAYKNENKAYQIGVGVGASKVKGDWELKSFWQSVDAFALDSNLVDSDLFDSRTNMEGLVFQGTYVLSNGVSVKLTYADADRKNDGLATYGAGDISAANLAHYHLFQADLSVKF